MYVILELNVNRLLRRILQSKFYVVSLQCFLSHDDFMYSGISSSLDHCISSLLPVFRRYTQLCVFFFNLKCLLEPFQELFSVEVLFKRLREMQNSAL